MVVRLRFLSEPMRYDEAKVFLLFGSQPLDFSARTYDYPGNQIFHTLLQHVSVRLFGEAEWALRLPAFLAGIALIPAVYAATRAIYDRDAALLAAALTVPAAGLVVFSTNARGYALVTLAFVILLGLGTLLVERPHPAGWAVWVAVAALGAYTIPIMVYPAAVTACWLTLLALFSLRGSRRRTVLTWLAASLVGAAALSALLYLPTFGDAGWREAQPVLPDVYRKIWESWTAGLTGVVVVALLAGVIAAVLLRDRIGRRRELLPASLVVLPVALLVTPHIPPFARMWLPLFPLLIIVGSGGLVALARSAGGERPVAALVAAATLLAVALAVALDRDDLPPLDDPPIRGAEQAADYLAPRLRRTEVVGLEPYAYAPIVAYYLRRNGLHQELAEVGADTARRPAFLVVLGRYTAEEALMRAGVTGPPPDPVARFDPGGVHDLRGRSGIGVVDSGEPPWTGHPALRDVGELP